METKHIERLYSLLSSIEAKDPDTASALRWAIFTLEQGAPAQSVTETMTRKDYLETWGFLEVLKTQFSEKVKAAAQRGDSTGDKLSADYAQQASAIQTMQAKIDVRVANMPE